MIPVFIGYDRRETVAYHVLAHSLLKHATVPLAITPIGNDTLPKGRWWRERGPHDSTDFSNARFMVPALMGYRGWAIFMDCDMVALGDIAELFEQLAAARALRGEVDEVVPHAELTRGGRGGSPSRSRRGTAPRPAARARRHAAG